MKHKEAGVNDLTWTRTQLGRLKELGVDPGHIPANFSTPEERNRVFQEIEKKQVRTEQTKLSDFLIRGEKTRIEILKEELGQALQAKGFARVTTPTIITRAALEKMTIDADHPLFHQVFWINDRQCLRPMLAPNLYSLMLDLGRLRHRPIRFFEMGSCFRKESDGARHNTEFTMLNLVEMGLPLENRSGRLRELAEMIARTAGLTDFEFESEDSAVYGTTLDLVAGPEKIEVASGAMGPHPLDAAWGITDSWVGMGFGIERLLMTSQGEFSIGRWGKNLSYLNGICLKL